MVHRNRGKLKAAGLVLLVDLLLDRRINHAPADILVDGVIGEAQIVLIGEAGESIGRRLLQKMLRQAQGAAQSNDLLGGVHPQGGEGSGAVAVNGAIAYPILGEVGGIDDRAAGQRLGHGIEGRHTDTGGQIHRGLAAGGEARPFHLL